MKIIAFSGKKQSGKTTAVEDLMHRLCEPADQIIETVSFTDRLKELVMEYILIPDGAKEDYSQFDKETFKASGHSCGLTVRGVLQKVSTDYLRTMWPDIWIKNYERLIKELCPDTVLTADVRFPNEVKCIQDLGGHVIRLLRNPYDDKHESETALDCMPLVHNGISIRSGINGEIEMHEAGYIKCTEGFDAMIDNCEMSIEQQNEAVWTLVNEKGWV